MTQNSYNRNKSKFKESKILDEILQKRAQQYLPQKRERLVQVRV